jgi:hypothetical protein
MTLSQNPVIQKSLRRLKNIGLKVYITDTSENNCVIIVDGESIIEAVKRIISKNITYNKFYIHYDRNDRTLVIFFWKGEPPPKVKALQLEAYRK